MSKVIVTLVLWLAVFSGVHADQSESAEPPANVRSIPGLTGPDTHPDACVSCHIRMDDIDLDARLSTALREWEQEVPVKVMEVAETASASPNVLKGRHPPMALPLEDVPSGCIGCHDSEPTAPPFAPLVHLAHYRRGAENHFVSVFSGECTLCHKMDHETGAWRIPSGSER